MFDRVLVPLDGSPRAENALPPLSWLADRPALEILLLQACPLRPVAAFEAAPLMPTGLDEARTYLEAVAARLRNDGFRVRPLLREGEAAESILDAAAEEKASLIVMATHGRSGLARFVFGSVAEKILRASNVPVLVFPAFEPARREAPRRILVPLEGEEAAHGLVAPLTELSRRGRAHVTLLHVADEPVTEAPFLQAVAASLAAEGVEGAAALRHGDPAAQILESARELRADLLAMSTHGRRGPSRWVFGSVTEKVLRAARTPLLVLRNAPVPEVVARAEATSWKE